MAGGWEDPDPAELLPLTSAAEWDELVRRYPSFNSNPRDRCFEVLRSNGAKCVVVETRYLDIDYRSEFSAFYSRTFASAADSTHRLHFFKRELRGEELWSLPEDPGYLGYIIIRPSTLGLIGRTMIAPPNSLRDAIRTAVEDKVNFFGQELRVEGVPFVQQDTQLGRCAHAAAWVCHFSAHRRGEVGRRAMAEFSLRADAAVGSGRQMPSPGLSVLQLLELFRTFDLPPLFYATRALPDSPLPPWSPADPPAPPPDPTSGQAVHPALWDVRLIRICCRYINSGLPVFVATSNHAFVLNGYTRVPLANGTDWIRFVRHDDQQGPYLEVNNVFKDTGYAPWEALIVPLPDKLWLPPEGVEKVAGEFLQSLAKRMADGGDTNAADVERLIGSNELALRTYAVPSNEFKKRLKDRGLDDTAVRVYRLLRMSRFVWVVELVNRTKRRAEEACVIGEAVIDATSSETDPHFLALHVPGVLITIRDDAGWVPFRCAPGPYFSGGAGAP